MDTTTSPTTGSDHRDTPTLCRPFHDRMIAGVASGLADYLGIDVTLARIGLAVLAVIGPGLPIYLAAWLLIPDEGATQSIAMDFIHPASSTTTS
jgi:phage shock protein C